jgi:hypothetical protein
MKTWAREETELHSLLTQHWIEVSHQLYDLAVLTSGKDPPVPITLEA